MTDVEQLLTQLRAQVDRALEALADEHEGHLTRAVAHITCDASRLGRIVSTW